MVFRVAKINWHDILHPQISELIKEQITTMDFLDDNHPMGTGGGDEAVDILPPPPPKEEKVVIDLFTPEQYQLQSLLESGLVDPKDQVFASSIANAPNATPNQLKWVKTILDKLLQPPPERYEFTQIFVNLQTSKRVTLEFRGYPIKLSVATDAAKHPGAIYMVSEEPDMNYIGRIDLDHSVVIPKRCSHIKEDLIRFLHDLNSDPLKWVKPAPKPVGNRYGVALVTAPPKQETIAQQVARGPFDPAKMQDVLSEFQNEDYWRR